MSRAAPPVESVFEPVVDRYGVRLALVFGNHAPGGACPYYVGTRCHHCDIGAGEGAAFSPADNRSRLHWLQARYSDIWPQVAHLVVYNSGSVLNAKEMPVAIVHEILSFASSLPLLEAVSLDSREPFIRCSTLISMAATLPPKVKLRPILGLESADTRIRNELLEKQMSLAAVERAFQEAGNAAEAVGQSRVGMDVNVLVGGPGTSDATAVNDARETAELALAHGHRYGISVDLSLHAYYPSSRGRRRFPDHPRCSLSVLFAAACEIKASLPAGADTGIFIGWQDEGHDIERDQRQQEIALARDAMDEFNRTQSPSVLRGHLNSHF